MRSPARSAAIQTSPSCAAPANGTVHTSARIADPPTSQATAMAAASMTFSSTGAAAAAANRPAALSAPEASAASEMNRM